MGCLPSRQCPMKQQTVAPSASSDGGQKCWTFWLLQIELRPWRGFEILVGKKEVVTGGLFAHCSDEVYFA